MGFLTIKSHKGFPQYIYNDTPEFSDIHEQIKYLEQEEKRINEGFEGLSPLMYFHLSKMKLKPMKGKTVPPQLVDTDIKLTNDFLWCLNYNDEKVKETNKIREGYDLDVIKRRRAHFTTIFGGTIPAWLAIADKYKGCTYPITSCDTTRLNELILNKLKPAINSAVQEGYIPESYFSNPEFMNFSSKAGKRDDSATTIYFLDTSKDDRAAAKAEGTGNVAALIDERLLHLREKKVKMSFEATLYDGIKKVGILISGGSANAFNMLAVRNLKESLKISPSDKKKIEFIAGWDGLIFDPITGITDKQAGIDYIVDRREQLRKENKWEELANFIKNYPLSIEELIGSVEGESFSPNVRENIDKGKIYAFNHEPLQINLLNRNNKIFTDNTPINIPDLIFPEGVKFPYRIYTPPIDGHIYIAGADPIDFMGSAVKGSLFSVVIKDITTNEYVASCEFRTTDPELGYNIWRNFLLYYKSTKHPMGALCLGEKNRISSIISLCQAKGTLDLLAFDPDKKVPTSNTDRGYHKSTDTISKLMTYTKIYLENNFIPFELFNESFINYETEPEEGQKKKKSDIVDAVLSCEFLHNSLSVHKPVREEKKSQTMVVLQRNSSGFMEEKIINI